MSRKNFEFLEIKRQNPHERNPVSRSKDFKEIQGSYTEKEAQFQASRCIDCGNPYCQFQCPVQNHIPQWLKLIKENRIIEAAELSHQTNSLPEICGRVCPQDRLCEGSCTLNDDFEAVSIGSIEKYITDTAFSLGWRPTVASNISQNKKVAIIGAGPAGLGCADVLVRHGFKPVVYDLYPEIGGLLSFGIPSFKLDKSVIQKRREIFEEMGVTFKLNTRVGQDISFDLIYEIYDAVFLSTGAYKKNIANIPGENLLGVHQALAYLVNNNFYQRGEGSQEKHINTRGERVVILGGGDTAMDCARSAVRQQASSVFCAYRRDRDSMPGSKKEVKKAEEEGVNFLWHSQPIEIIGDSNNKIIGVKFIDTQWVSNNDNQHGDKKLIANPQSEKIIPADKVVIAFGFKPEVIPWLSAYDIDFQENGCIIAKDANQHPFQTNNNKIFSGGDMRGGPDLVVTAIFEGRSAAKSIINYLTK